MRSSLLAGLACLALACGGGSVVDEDNSQLGGPRRDFRAHPALLDLDADDIYAISDPHGGLIAMGQLLQANGLVDSAPSDLAHASKVKWTGGTAVLVVVGDLIDKGSESLGVVDFLRALEPQAEAAGGRVIVTMGNHEAEFFVDPENEKAMSTEKNAIGINVELEQLGIDPKELAEGRDVEGRGLWLRNLPLGVKIKKWFFAHAGNTDGRSMKDLQKKLEDSIDHNGFGDDDITGKDSILEAEKWFGDEDKDDTVHDYAEALDVEHIVIGHDPGAFGESDKIEANNDCSLVKINVEMGLTLNNSNTSGMLLHITTRGSDTAEAVDSRGKRTKLL